MRNTVVLFSWQHTVKAATKALAVAVLAMIIAAAAAHAQCLTPDNQPVTLSGTLAQVPALVIQLDTPVCVATPDGQSMSDIHVLPLVGALAPPVLGRVWVQGSLTNQLTLLVASITPQQQTADPDFLPLLGVHHPQFSPAAIRAAVAGGALVLCAHAPLMCVELWLKAHPIVRR